MEIHSQAWQFVSLDEAVTDVDAERNVSPSGNMTLHQTDTSVGRF